MSNEYDSKDTAVDGALASEQTRHNNYKKAKITADLKETKARGKTYNQMYEDEFQKNVKNHEINSDAIKHHQAYELYQPKEVRKAVDSDPTYYSAGVNTPEHGKRWEETFAPAQVKDR